MPSPYDMAKDAIAAATTADAAQAAYNAALDDVSGAQAAQLKTALDMRLAALAKMDRAETQKTNLMNAAGMIDTSAEMTAEQIAAAKINIAALKAAIAAAVDVDDTSMYQTQVTAAEAHVMESQSALDHTAQTMALMDAVAALRMIDLGDLTTQEKIDAAEDAIAVLKRALDGASELSDAEKVTAMTQLATANRIVMGAQGRTDKASQMQAIEDAAAALAMIDLDALMTQAQIDAAQEAIDALDLALNAATDVSDAEKLDDTVDVTVAKRRVAMAKETLAENVGNQRMALTEAGTALGMIDLDDLDTAEKVADANEAVEALKMALAAATHLTDAEKAMYQTQLDTATETVRMAQTGMDSMQRMEAQRTAVTNAVTMARTAVNGVKNASTDSEVSSAEQAIADLEKAIADAVDIEGEAVVAEAQGTVDTLKAQLKTAKDTRTAYLADKDKTDTAAMNKLGEDLHAALGGAAADTDALANVTATTLGTAGLGVTAADDAGALTGMVTVPTLKAGESAGALGSWMGTNYAHTDTGTKVENSAIVYTNQGPGTRMAFGDVHEVADESAGSAPGFTAIKGSLTVDGADAAVRALVTGTAFTHSGSQGHTVDPDTGIFTTRGYFDGAPGQYRCTGACSSTNDGEGGPSVLAGTWHFKPDAGAMVHQPDANYLYYGWWLNKDKDGVPMAASAFAGVVGTVAGDGTTALTTAPDTLTGSATYSGKAAGKYAMSNPLDGTGEGGHFTADASLTAKFGANADPNNGGVSGTINNFMAGGEAKPWSVELKRAGWDSGAATFGGTGNEATTVWSINGNKAPESGGWSGTMYDELPGATSADPPGDGSDIPTTVTGTFYSEFSTIGRMVGGFGADKQ